MYLYCVLLAGELEYAPPHLLWAEGVALQGNLDPQWLVVGGEGMLAAARSVLDGFRTRRHVFNLGHGISPEVPPAHVDALASLLRSVRA